MLFYQNNFLCFQQKTKNIKMFKNPYKITSNEIKSNEFDYIYLHKFEVLNFVTNGILSIKNYCLDEKKINKSKFYNLYDYSYIKYRKC